VREQRGRINAETVNGSIACELDRLVAGERHSLRTVNGTVELVLGPEAEGEVDARAVNGRVRMDIEGATNLATPTRTRKSVRFGEGEGGACRVRTVNGAIRVTRADS